MYKTIKNFVKTNTGILIRLDDIAENMNWDLMDRSEKLFKKYSIKPVLGVIPNNDDKSLMIYPRKKDFWDRVRKWRDKGWEIAMHGYSHVYDKNSKKDDYFNYGGGSEFFGHTLENQSIKIKNGLKKFDEENIKIRTFFAPNHTYDKNTFLALKDAGIKEIIDGYGLFPYEENDIKFIPQLFHKVICLPFGIQSTQIHLNYWKNKDFDKFEKFVQKNADKVISYDEALIKTRNDFFSNVLKQASRSLLRIKRIF